MVDDQGNKWKLTKVNEPETIHLTSEKAKALT